MKQPLHKCLLWALGMALAVSSLSGSNGRPIIEEKQGKALLVYNIAKFTVWPPEMVGSGEAFVITLWDDDTLAQAFQVIEGQQTHGRTVRIKRSNRNTLPAGSEVLIITKHELKRFLNAREALSTAPILTVTTDPRVFKAGAMVLVEVVNDHLSFSVNLGKVKESGLEISGNLLRHAKEVNF